MKKFLTLALLLGAFVASPVIAGCMGGCAARTQYVENTYEAADDLDGQDEGQDEGSDEGTDDVDGNEEAEEINEGRAA